jgi:hypothetical protein
MAGTYFDLLKAVENYYGAGSDQWLAMATQSATAAERAQILRQIPNVYTAVNESGQLLSWSLGVEESALTAGEAAASNAAAVINSNAISSGAQTLVMEVPGNAQLVGQTVEITSGATAVGAAGTGTATLECVLGHAATWLLGAGIGMKLGVWLDAGLYNLAPDFWDENNLLFVDPERFKEHFATNWLLENSGYPVAPVLSDSEGQFYCDEELFAYFAKYMYEQGFFADYREIATKGDITDDKFYYPQRASDAQIFYTNDHHIEFKINTAQNMKVFDIVSDHDVYSAILGTPEGVPYPEYYGSAMLLCVSEHPFEVNGHTVSTTTMMKDGTGLYYYVPFGPLSGANLRITFSTMPVNIINLNAEPDAYYTNNDIPYLLIHGDHEEQGQREGVHKYGDLPVFTDDMTLQQILDALKQQFPDLFQDRARVGTLNDDGTITNRFYIPFNIPSGGDATQPTTSPEDKSKINPDDDPDVDPAKDPQAKNARQVTQPVPDPDKPADPGTGKGQTPPYVVPAGTADALYSIYNPTVAEVKSLGSWLWSTNFVDQLLKMFNNPMDAIISLHKIYGTPHIGGRQNIKVGYLDSGVTANVVDEQYITIDCGTVNLYEVFANVFDYAPYTELNLYLPFVGIVSLDVADVMRGQVNVIYHIDVITGAVLVEVKVIRDAGAGGVIYQYTGSCAEHYPLSSGSYMGIVTGAAGIAGGVAATIATGGAAAPMLLGAAAGLGGMHTNIQKSSSFTANAGAMGIKKPYFIISRPQPAMANNYGHYVGHGSNTLVTLNSLSGYIKVKDIYLDNNPGMTDEEQQMLKTVLKEGVVL